MSYSRTVRGRLLCIVFSLAFAAIGGRAIFAQLGGQGPNDAEVLRRVNRTLLAHHLLTSDRANAKSIDHTDISRRAFKTLMKEFDPARVYFEQGDIDEFKVHETTIEKEISQGEIKFAYEVRDRFLARARERLSLVEELVHMPHDFDADEFLSTDYDNLPYASTPDEMRDRWRKRIKLDLVNQHMDKTGLSEAEQKEKVLKRYRNFVHRWEQTGSDEMLEIFLNALTTSFDPHTNYMSPTTLEDFNISMRLSLDGIGARLRSDDGFTIVDEVVAGGAADQDGRLKVSDKIVGVAEDGVNVVDVIDMKLTDVVKKIRGKRGTLVTLRVLPAGKTDRVDYTLTREQIKLTESEAHGEVIETGDRGEGKPYRIGYIELPSFYRDITGENTGGQFKSSTEDVKQILQKFRKQGGIDSLIMDLRANGGGALTESISLTGLFINHGSVVQVKGGSSGVQTYEDEDNNDVEYAGPLVVLVSKLSASASEIFAGAIQDYRRGLIVGDISTHGKGTVQTVQEIARGFGGRRSADMGAIKLTIQQFYRVNGDSTQSRGVLSDLVLPSKWDHIEKIGEANLDNALPFSKVAAVEHPNLGWVTPEIIRQLQALSDNRRQTSTEFQKLDAEISRFEETQRRKAIPLNEAKYRAEIKGEDKEGDDEPTTDSGSSLQPKKKKSGAWTGLERNFYNNEVLAIVTDYLRLGPSSKVAANVNKL